MFEKIHSAEYPATPARKSIDFVGAFFNEIRLTASEILLRNVKYALRMKYLLRKCFDTNFISLDALASNFTIHVVNYFTVSVSERFH